MQNLNHHGNFAAPTRLESYSDILVKGQQSSAQSADDWTTLSTLHQ